MKYSGRIGLRYPGGIYMPVQTTPWVVVRALASPAASTGDGVLMTDPKDQAKTPSDPNDLPTKPDYDPDDPSDTEPVEDDA